MKPGAIILTGAKLAEQAGSYIASEMLDAVFNSADQAEAVRAVQSAINDAFNPDNDSTLDAVAGGFSVRIVNVLERGFAAIRADGEGAQ